MSHEDLKGRVQTPAFIFDERVAVAQFDLLKNLRNRCRLSVLFPLKSFSLIEGLSCIASHVEGFAVSSLFEALLAKDISTEEQTIHMSSVGLCERELSQVIQACDYVTFNSLSQFERFANAISDVSRIGIRVNPELSFVGDKRYDPCREFSKLGVRPAMLSSLSEFRSELSTRIRGLMFHTNCESDQLDELLETVRHLCVQIPSLLEQVNWINLGGGYLFDESTDWTPLIQAVELLDDQYNLDVFFEPGKGVIGEAGMFVASVLDTFESDGQNIAILDTTANHMPEVFEYQYKPSVAEESPDGCYRYILAGASCLAGDLFGEYSFDEPLTVGSRIVFEDMGSYTLVKAHMFNGINLPRLYVLDLSGGLRLVKEFDYRDFILRCGGNSNAVVRKADFNLQRSYSSESSE